MWLPTPIYQRIPAFWLVMGTLFLMLGLYIGFHFALIYVYLGLGVVCIVRGIWVHLIRQRYRDKKNSNNGGDVPLDKTGATPVGG